MADPEPRRARFEALFREHHPAVRAYARRRVPSETVDDIVSETFLVVWRRLDSDSTPIPNCLTSSAPPTRCSTRACVGTPAWTLSQRCACSRPRWIVRPPPHASVIGAARPCESRGSLERSRQPCWVA
ncbi:MAG: RNA polymerase sigma factor [Solirubrobacteraceae bacterium]